jgi:hypothetical protein
LPNWLSHGFANGMPRLMHTSLSLHKFALC